MSKAKKILIGIVVAILLGVGGLFAYASNLPSTWHASGSAVVSAPAAAIYPALNNLKRWEEWTPWGIDRFPERTMTYTGPEAGVDAEMAWDGPEIGKGRLKIVDTESPARITYQLFFDDMPTPSKGGFALEQAEGGTKVTWTDDGDMGDSIMGRLFVAQIETMVGADFVRGLENLEKLARAGKLQAPAPADQPPATPEAAPEKTTGEKI